MNEQTSNSPTYDQRVIRVFVSSTFRDMQAERDELIKQTFPRLRKLCDERNVVWSEVDLRWGITQEQSERGEVLPICLAEIQRCRPYFIGLLGERYGWIPDEIPQELIDQEKWLEEHLNHSVTELEILHGVLRDRQMNDHALFYFRDSAYLDSLSDEEKSEFIELASEDEIKKYGQGEAEKRATERKQKLIALKERIREHCEKNEMPAPREFPSPKELGEMVWRDMSEIIERLYPKDEIPELLDREALEHEAFAQSRKQVYIGRQDYFQRLDAHANCEDQPLVILGESGSGKSALLSNWALQYRENHTEDLLIMHFIGATPYSADWAAMLRRIMGELKRRFDIQQEIPDKPDELRSVFANFLHMAAAKGRCVIILDALNQLEDRDGALDLVWLPPFIPPNVRMILSTLPGRPLDNLKERGLPTLQIELLDFEERKKLIKDYLAQFSKELNDPRTALLANAKQTANPLFLRALLDELRVFGIHEKLDERIAHYLEAETVDKLYEKILTRYEQDYERERPDLVKDAMSLIWASRRGLSEAELLDLLGTNDEPLPQAYWSPLYLAAESSLVSKSGLINFGHDYFRKAVRDKYLLNEKQQQNAHLKLADFFERQELRDRKIDELPWQLTRGQFWERLFNTLFSPLFFERIWDNKEYEVIEYWKELEKTNSFHANQILENMKPFVWDKSVLVEKIKGIFFRVAELLSKIDQSRIAYNSYKILEELFQETGDFENLQACVGNQAICYTNLKEYKKALVKFKEQEDIARKISNKTAVVNAVCGQAVIYGIKGDHKTALTLLKGVEDLPDNNFDPLIRAGLLSNLGITFSKLKRHSDALGKLNQAKSIFLSQQRPDFLLKCLRDTIQILEAQGDLKNAVQASKEAVSIAKREGNKKSELDFLFLQASIEVEQKNLLDAEKLYEEIEPLCRQLNEQHYLVTSLVFRAAMLSEHHHQNDDALPLAEEGYKLARNLEQEIKKSAWTVLSNIRRSQLQNVKIEKGDGVMNQELFLASQLIQRLERDDKIRVLTVLHDFESGFKEYYKNNFIEATNLHEKALSQIESIKGAETLLAIIKGQLVVDYAALDRYDEALAIGKDAIIELAKEQRAKSK